MNQTDFAVATYDPAVALEFFRAAGKPATIAEGEQIFSEHERAIPLIRRHKMYLLLKGEVGLVAGRKPIGRVRPGEIFGEMAILSDAPRSASAVAKSACRVIALDDNEFETALRKKPEFALMLISVMIFRLRSTIAELKARGEISADAAIKESAAFEPAVLAKLLEGLADDPPIFFRQGASIVADGQKGTRMYAVAEGRVAVSIGGRVVERLGPGGVFGEAALLHPSGTRMADVVAETDCSLQAIGRTAFLSLVKVSPSFGDAMLSSLASRLRYLTGRL
ncbi:MAG TPA: cyclic nucleotide-binding domain-containing protein [Burkholderiales bacterium]|nr:cyclic nucleotide-binding domain-containing protein [Burkholderiales bacterium]